MSNPNAKALCMISKHVSVMFRKLSTQGLLEIVLQKILEYSIGTQAEGKQYYSSWDDPYFISKQRKLMQEQQTLS